VDRRIWRDVDDPELPPPVGDRVDGPPEAVGQIEVARDLRRGNRIPLRVEDLAPKLSTPRPSPIGSIVTSAMPSVTGLRLLTKLEGS
jgi:hypothetical protein